MGMEGADPATLRRAAVAVRTLAGGLQNQVHYIAGLVDQMRWSGDSGRRVEYEWQSCSAVLSSAIAGLIQAAVSLDRNADQQDTASAAAGPGGTGTSTLGHDLNSAFGDVERFSTNWGFIAGPLMTAIPAIGGLTGGLQSADPYFRGAQDLLDGHYQAAFNAADGIASSHELGAGFDAFLEGDTHAGVVGALTGVDLIIFQQDVEAFRQVNWDYTIHHLSQLNPLAPGAMSAVIQGEEAGFKTLGENLYKDTVGSAISSIVHEF